MSTQITTLGVHHFRLIVTNPERSRAFYTSVLNFRVLAEVPPGFVLTNGSLILGITSPWDTNQAIPNDRFSPNRVGLDHLSFSVASRAELQQAADLFDEKGIEHGEIKNLSNMTILSFSDPDGIQLELSAPLA